MVVISLLFIYIKRLKGERSGKPRRIPPEDVSFTAASVNKVHINTKPTEDNENNPTNSRDRKKPPLPPRNPTKHVKQ